MIEIKVKKLHPQAKLPTKAHPDDACFDIYAVGNTALDRGEITEIHTGIAMQVPKGYMLELRPRSGLALGGFRIANSPATVDSSFRGEVIVIGVSSLCRIIRQGDRIAQARLVKLLDTSFIWSEELSETDRGNAGLGSTGR